MANYHILAGRPDGNQLRVAFHLPMPSGDNAVGISYQNALAMHLGSGSASIVSALLLGAGEQAALDEGELYEHVWQFDTRPEMTLMEKRDALDARYTAFTSAIINQLQMRLEYYGYSRDVT